MSYLRVVTRSPALTPSHPPLQSGLCIGLPAHSAYPWLSEPDSSLLGMTWKKTSIMCFLVASAFDVFVNFLNQGNKTLNKLPLC